MFKYLGVSTISSAHLEVLFLSISARLDWAMGIVSQLTVLAALE